MKTQTSHLLLNTEEWGNGILIEAHAHGTLDGNDYDVLLPELDAVLSTGRPLNFLLVLDNFRGWDLESFWRELKWDEKNRDRLGRIAIVGETDWHKWSVRISKGFVAGNVRYFDRRDEAAARAWLRTG
jgi:hypothetical protein